MSEKLVINSILNLVPQWYQSDTGKESYSLTIGKTTQTFFSHRKLTPQLAKLKEYAEENAAKLIAFSIEFPASIAVDLIQEFLALRWLDLVGPQINWKKGLAYCRELNERTYENSSVTKNLIIGKKKGSLDITLNRHSKVIDPLATSPQACIRVDGDFRFCDFFEIPWKAISDKTEYKYHPEFLHPFFCVLSDDEFSLHKTPKNDLVIMQGGASNGIIATKRRGRWKFYDTNTLKNSIYEVLGDYRIACNLYETLFDLSFRRHGALLVFDPVSKVIENIANPHACIFNKENGDESAHAMLAESVKKIRMSEKSHRDRRVKRVFLELASLDGATIFDENHVLAFGAMIKTHEKAKGQYGARTTAALSAYWWGSLPIKISSDGEVVFYFTSVSKDGTQRSPALMKFA